MSFDINIVFFIAILVFVIVVGFILHNISTVAQEKKNRELEEELDNLSKIIKQKSLDDEIYSSSNNTSFIASKIKTQETLQSEVDRLKKTLENTKKIAQDASMIKIDFLTNVRHEIRTPMNSILVFAQMIESESLDRKLVTFAGNIVQSGNNLLNLFNNIIELSEIESGSFTIKNSAVDIRNFMYIIVDSYRREAAKKGLSLAVDIDKTIPESIMIDASRVREILNNLIINALEFTEHGGVKVTLSQEVFDQVNNEVSIRFCVEDTGIGILKNNQEKIFRIFENRESSKDIEYQGTGLGLSINRKLAELMNGTLQVQSEIGKGSKFALTLNNLEIVLANNSQGIDESQIDFNVLKENSKIVIIDDDKATLEMVKNNFQKSKVDVLSYFNVRDAITTLKSEKIDILIINVEILTMDDGAVSKVIKSISNAPVVTLVNSRLVNIDFSKEGVQPVAHLKKPLQKVELFRVALKILNTQNLVLDANGDVGNEDLGLSFSGDETLVTKFFDIESEVISKLLNKAIKTKDLGNISLFAKTIEKLSIKYKMDKLNEFAKELQEKVNNFDIEAIDDMLSEYKNKSEQRD